MLAAQLCRGESGGGGKGVSLFSRGACIARWGSRHDRAAAPSPWRRPPLPTHTLTLRQNSAPIWLPHWPTCRVTTSRGIGRGVEKKGSETRETPPRVGRGVRVCVCVCCRGREGVCGPHGGAGEAPSREKREETGVGVGRPTRAKNNAAAPDAPDPATPRPPLFLTGSNPGFPVCAFAATREGWKALSPSLKGDRFGGHDTTTRREGFVFSLLKPGHADRKITPSPPFSPTTPPPPPHRNTPHTQTHTPSSHGPPHQHPPLVGCSRWPRLPRSRPPRRPTSPARPSLTPPPPSRPPSPPAAPSSAACSPWTRSQRAWGRDFCPASQTRSRLAQLCMASRPACRTACRRVCTRQ